MTEIPEAEADQATPGSGGASGGDGGAGSGGEDGGAPDGKPIGTQPLQYYWPYHHAVVLSVEGELRVLDLSLGDAPLPVDEWVAGFVEPSITCHTSDEVHQQAWVYWNSAFSNLELPDPPSVLCAYTITPIFTERRDQVPSNLVDAIRFVPFEMNVQLGSLQPTLSGEYGVSLPEKDLPRITSRYSAGTIGDVCLWARMRFCDHL